MRRCSTNLRPVLSTALIQLHLQDRSELYESLFRACDLTRVEETNVGEMGLNVPTSDPLLRGEEWNWRAKNSVECFINRLKWFDTSG